MFVISLSQQQKNNNMKWRFFVDLNIAGILDENIIESVNAVCCRVHQEGVQYSDGPAGRHLRTHDHLHLRVR